MPASFVRLRGKWWRCSGPCYDVADTHVIEHLVGSPPARDRGGAIG
jgi:hypothetical protein